MTFIKENVFFKSIEFRKLARNKIPSFILNNFDSYFPFKPENSIHTWELVEYKDKSYLNIYAVLKEKITSAEKSIYPFGIHLFYKVMESNTEFKNSKTRLYFIIYENYMYSILYSGNKILYYSDHKLKSKTLDAINKEQHKIDKYGYKDVLILSDKKITEQEIVFERYDSDILKDSSISKKVPNLLCRKKDYKKTICTVLLILAAFITAVNAYFSYKSNDKKRISQKIQRELSETKSQIAASRKRIEQNISSMATADSVTDLSLLNSMVKIAGISKENKVVLTGISTGRITGTETLKKTAYSSIAAKTKDYQHFTINITGEVENPLDFLKFIKDMDSINDFTNFNYKILNALENRTEFEISFTIDRKLLNKLW